MKSKNIFYWGDLDIQGFHILHQMRSYYSQTKSIMMDKSTYEKFEMGVVRGELSNTSNLDFLDDEEKEVFKFLKAGNMRLEQEKILQSYADSMLKSLIR